MPEKVLFVDDNKFTLELIHGLFKDGGFHLLTANNAIEATQIARQEDICLVVSDNVMPVMSGVEFLSSLKSISPDTVKVLMSAYADLSSALAAINCSEVFRYILKPWRDEEMIATVQEGLKRYRLIQSMRREDEDILHSLAQTIELKDPSTKGHCDRVAVYAMMIAERLELPKEMLREIKYGSWLHDCGKIGISEFILNGPRKLNDNEYEMVKKHALWGADVATKAHLSEVARNIIHYHHERFDGTGYPCGLVGEEIPIEARVVAVADVFDALSSNRPYRPAFPREKTLQMMDSMRGNVLDPHLAELFLDIVCERSDLPLPLFGTC